jgi:hypothetical protein
MMPTPSTWLVTAREAGALQSLLCPLGQFGGEGESPGAGVTGSVTLIEPPATTAHGALEDENNVFIYTERLDYTLPQDIPVDISEPGFYRNKQTSPGVVPAGTVVDVYMMHYDPVDNGDSQPANDVSINVGTEILGLIKSKENLDGTDDVLGAEGVVYEKSNARFWENDEDNGTFSDDRMTFTIHDYKTTNRYEQVRVITAAGSTCGSSYGMNADVDLRNAPRNQVVLMEYDMRNIDARDESGDETDHHRASLENMEDTERLHFGNLNALFADGTVRPLSLAEAAGTSAIWDADD